MVAATSGCSLMLSRSVLIFMHGLKSLIEVMISSGMFTKTDV